jgi:hypothetical protein
LIPVRSIHSVPIFDVGIMDFMKIYNKGLSKERLILDNKDLENYIKNNRYTKKYYIRYNNILYSALSLMSDS